MRSTGSRHRGEVNPTSTSASPGPGVTSDDNSSADRSLGCRSPVRGNQNAPVRQVCSAERPKLSRERWASLPARFPAAARSVGLISSQSQTRDVVGPPSTLLPCEYKTLHRRRLKLGEDSKFSGTFLLLQLDYLKTDNCRRAPHHCKRFRVSIYRSLTPYAQGCLVRLTRPQPRHGLA